MAVLWFHLAIMFVAPNHLEAEADSEQLWGETATDFSCLDKNDPIQRRKRMKTYENV